MMFCIIDLSLYYSSLSKPIALADLRDEVNAYLAAAARNPNPASAPPEATVAATAA
jgi:hypothetical protein